MSLRKIIKDELFPLGFRCLICGRETFGGDFCADCRRQIEFNSGIVCPVCGRKTARAEICIECKAHAPVCKKSASAFVYSKGAVTLIARFKTGQSWLADYFAPIMAEKLNTLPQFDLITYVPMTDRAKRRRGYNQAQMLAEKIGALCGKEVAGALEKTVETPPQKELARAERIKNLQGSFKADGGAVKGKKILLTDDVTTTGATLDCVAQALKNAGACEVYGLTVASVENKSI